MIALSKCAKKRNFTNIVKISIKFSQKFACAGFQEPVTYALVLFLLLISNFL